MRKNLFVIKEAAEIKSIVLTGNFVAPYQFLCNESDFPVSINFVSLAYEIFRILSLYIG